MKFTKSSTTAFAVVAGLLLSGAQAHYTFDQLLINDVPQGRPNEYIRQHKNGYMPTKFNKTPDGSITPLDADFTCNKGSVPAANVFTVRAGDKIGLKQAYGADGMLHPGPSQVYIARVPDAKTPNIAGLDWFKVHQSLMCSVSTTPDKLLDEAWCSWGENNVWFNMPASIPDGDYLVRGEHIGLHGAHGGEAEFYYACAQIRVEGNGQGQIVGEAVSIPGVYAAQDPAVNFSIWGRVSEYNFIPGPDVVPGGVVRGTATGQDGDVQKVVAGAATAPEPTPTPTPTPVPTSPSKGSGCRNSRVKRAQRAKLEKH